MANLFNIEGICKTPTSRFISVEIEGKDAPYIIRRDKFEQWVDSSDRRHTGVIQGNISWFLYYESNAFEKDVYDYIVLLQFADEDAFDIRKSLSIILTSFEGKASY